PVVYALGPGTLGIPASDLLFVSSNPWDVAGAKAFGYQAAWCNRTDAPEEELGVRPDVVVRVLDQLPRWRRGGEKSTGDSLRRAAHGEPEMPAQPYFLPASFFRFT